MTKRVNPVPSVPATPAKQNPNPTDNVRRKPDDQGFQSILDKHTGGGKRGNDAPDNLRTGGKVSKALKSAGFYDKGKTTSERKKIVSKVTTKPQRVAMVERMFSTKKMKTGGMASKRADGIAIRGKTRA